MAFRKVLEVAWQRPIVVHVAELLLDCGHVERIERNGNRLPIPELKHCLACDARGEPPDYRVPDEVFRDRRLDFCDRIDRLDVEHATVAQRDPEVV